MEENNNKYKYKNLLVVGNGFDKDLGLPTTYREFVSSWIFKRMYVKRSKENPNPSLIHFLYGKKFYDKWYDIEAALLEYISRRPDGSFVNNVEEDKKDYELLCSALIEYLTSLFQYEGKKAIEQSERMEASAAGQLLSAFLDNHYNAFYSFNYTPINLIARVICDKDFICNPVRLHGFVKDESIWNEKVKDNAIIIGVETKNIEDIAPGYSFLFKTNRPDYSPSNISQDLIAAQHVIIFGHSLNNIDSGYFEDYFNCLTSNNDRNRKLTIITRNQESRMTLLDNLRKMNISVLKMFAHCHVDFIQTEKMENKDSGELKKFENLLEGVA